MLLDLDPQALRGLSPASRLAFLKEKISGADQVLHERHLASESGLKNAQARSEMIDELIRALYETLRGDHEPNFTIVANGGYGREIMNPGSDIDLLFLTNGAANKLTKADNELIQAIQMTVWDLGFKFLPSTRSASESITEAKGEPISRTTLLDSRFIAGSKELYLDFKIRFRKECIKKDKEAFFEERSLDIKRRHAKWSQTVFLQEPNIKESPGTLRDYHNLVWVIDAEADTRSMTKLISKKILTRLARRELKDAFYFMHRVRNALQYHDKGNDILTLRFQGVLADEFKYPQRTILRRIEAFMRDYYTHARHIHNHTKSIFEIFELQHVEEPSGFRFLPFSKKKPKTIQLEDYTIRQGRLFAKGKEIFGENPNRLIRLFVYCQKHQVRPSPALRKLIKASWDLIDSNFRIRQENREAFREILQHKGQVAKTLRLMHRCGVLGRYLPEFGALDCLVQHEFFHRYTADEHTLRCIDQLDKLLAEDNPKHGLYLDLFLKHQDPYALYVALILHDTGRAENVREHIDGSSMLAVRLCKRLQITGGRRSLIMFLVDHHLTLWRFATKKNIDDPEVIAEFAGLMRDRHRLDTLLLFTFADSNGTNEEAWSPWKETLILQLYRNTREYLSDSPNSGKKELAAEFEEIRSEVKSGLKKKYHNIFEGHFKLMPRRYFRFRSKRSIHKHIVALWQFIDRRQRRPDTPFECAVQWLERPKFGYTELIIAAEETPLLLEKICCTLASHELNILSADIYTRPDGIVLDLFRVCTKDFKAEESVERQKSAVKTLYAINESETYDASKYLKKKINYLNPETEQVINFPTRAWISNELDPHFTVIELQALDRIGLLHDVFRTVNAHGLKTVHSRICTEKGAALDSIFVSTQEGGKLTDQEAMDRLENDLNTLITG
ncbi:[protein-PII] uridylyltransferase [Akkermansiaceae bacterium]|nr:[protein-PII] uridylyltransferase [Akkermansiaceae bacterium]MDB4504465.1 [protein-PII] uridylyltransferase [Akkermansiaceae bacterium]MDB4525893.1 [protein-PII] uridylyltransferase [Akkermansiaceae bacterium]MDB4547140.1 [protein-PII] uridylyltransferase [Akkermansiaceae bacterium]MDB4725696.1 [protein-PII] uridylyltransferase [Akkermansiaceae bacterium]